MLKKAFLRHFSAKIVIFCPFLSLARFLFPHTIARRCPFALVIFLQKYRNNNQLFRNKISSKQPLYFLLINRNNAEHFRFLFTPQFGRKIDFTIHSEHIYYYFYFICFTLYDFYILILLLFL